MVIINTLSVDIVDKPVPNQQYELSTRYHKLITIFPNDALLAKLKSIIIANKLNTIVLLTDYFNNNSLISYHHIVRQNKTSAHTWPFKN